MQVCAIVRGCVELTFEDLSMHLLSQVDERFLWQGAIAPEGRAEEYETDSVRAKIRRSVLCSYQGLHDHESAKGMSYHDQWSLRTCLPCRLQLLEQISADFSRRCDQLLVSKPCRSISISHNSCIGKNARQHSIVAEPVDIVLWSMDFETVFPQLAPCVVRVGASSMYSDNTALISSGQIERKS